MPMSDKELMFLEQRSFDQMRKKGYDGPDPENRADFWEIYRTWLNPDYGLRKKRQEKLEAFRKNRQEKLENAFNFLNKKQFTCKPYWSKSRHEEKWYDDNFTQLLIQNKNTPSSYGASKKIATVMYDFMQENNLTDFDYLIPVPSFSDQYKSGFSICSELETLSKIPMINILKKTIDIQVRNLPKIEKRKLYDENDVFVVMPIDLKILENKTILLIDDILTDGDTIKQCIYQLTEKNPKDITVLCAGKTPSANY